MTTAQPLCDVNQVLADLNRSGQSDFKNDLAHHILGASRLINNLIKLKRGGFIPQLMTIRMDGRGRETLRPPVPVISLTSLTHEGSTLTQNSDFVLVGDSVRTPHWDNGPYSRIRRLNADWINDDDNTILVGMFGLYYETKTLAIDAVTLASGSTDTLAVSDGAAVAPMMILEVEDEQILIESVSNTTTAATSLLNGALTKTDEAVVVDDASEFNEGEVIQVDVEDILIQRINTSTNTLGVRRGWNETAKAAHDDDSAINIYRTFNIKRGVNGTTAAAHTSQTAIQVVPPDDVNMLARELAGVSIQRASTGWAGREGNEATGQMYFYSVPDKEIKRVLDNYRIHMMG